LQTLRVVAIGGHSFKRRGAEGDGLVDHDK
jgi:hypothetical protein